MSVFLISKPISYFFRIYMGWFFYLETIECSLVQDLMASIGKRVGNLNSGRRYLITVVLFPYNRHLFFISRHVSMLFMYI